MDELLDTAFRLFANNGYEATSVRELNRQLGVSHGLTHLRIGSKEKLWRLAVRHALANSGRVVVKLFEDSDETDDLERLRQALIALVEWFAEFPEGVRLINHEGGHDTARLAYLCENVYPHFVDQLAKLLGRLESVGRIRPVPVLAFASLVVYGAGGYFAQMPMHEKLGEKPPRTPAHIRKHAELMADLLMGGLTAPAALEAAGELRARGGRKGAR